MSPRMRLGHTLGLTTALAVASVTALPIASYAQTTPYTRLAATAEAAVKQLDLPVPASGPITRLQAIEGVEPVVGLASVNSGTPFYTDVPATAAGFGAVQAAVGANLMAGWLATTGTFSPSEKLYRTQLAILATNALGLGTQANGLITDTRLYGYLWDLSRAGYNLGFANAMLEEGVVPPMNNVRYMPNAGVTQPMFAVTLYRMWLLYDLPYTTSITPQGPSVLTNHPDNLTYSVLNRLGTAIPPVNLARYTLTYSVQGTNASFASVTSGVFTASAPGTYTVVASIDGPLLRTPVSAQTTITVTSPSGPPAPGNVYAAPVCTGGTDIPISVFLDSPGGACGISVTWTASPGATGYELLMSNGGPYALVPDADDGGPLGAGATSADVSGSILTSGDYTFEVVAEGAGGSTTSSPSNSVAYNYTPPI